MLKNKRLIVLISLMMLVAFTLTGCGNGMVENGDVGDAKEKVEILFVEWACARAQTYITADILENIMGYDVEMSSLAASAMYQGLANDEADLGFTSWLPLTHGDYVAQLGDKIEIIGPNYEGAKIGLVVPTYVDIDSIEELNGVKDKFAGEIIGIDPGAGIMQATNKALEDYDLDFELMEGSDATMAAALKEAIALDEWVVVTGWSPHWKFATWDLKYLEDPKLVYGEAETISSIARTGLKEDLPEVYELLNNFHWGDEDIGAAMALAEEMGDSKLAARKWVEDNQDLVNSWLPEKYRS